MSGPCEQLHDFADGELAAPERPAFHRHLATCLACQHALENALMLDVLASGFTAGPAPGDDRGASTGPGARPPAGR